MLSIILLKSISALFLLQFFLKDQINISPKETRLTLAFAKLERLAQITLTLLSCKLCFIFLNFIVLFSLRLFLYFATQHYGFSIFNIVIFFIFLNIFPHVAHEVALNEGKTIQTKRIFCECLSFIYL